MTGGNDLTVRCPDMKKNEELLPLSAPLAWQWAPALCRRNSATGADCSYGHGIWQYLNLMGLLATPEPRRDFYQNALQATSNAAGTPRILISGAADYAMLDFVYTSFGRRGIAPDIIVTDLCETPLALNRWYSERTSWRIKTICCNILDLAVEAPFDAVCTDYFLSKFPAARRGTLVQKWRELLRPGGVLITATRLRPVSEGAIARFSPQQVEKLRAITESMAREMQATLRLDPAEFAGRAAVYAANYATHAVHTPEEVRALFEGCGFSVSHLAVENAPQDNAHDVSGPTMRGDAKHYLTIVAQRL